MPALNFKAQFAEMVETGEKRQTVRARRKDGKPRAKVGDTIKLYTGMRTKDCRLLGEAQVTRVDDIEINSTYMRLNDRMIYSWLSSRDELMPTDDEFAQADGFNGFMEMADWFENVHGLPFVGTVIYWDKPR